MSRWYGNVQNRIMEDRQIVDEIKIGTPITECFWSDRHCYETVKVIDQKHIIAREYAVKNIGGAYSQDWELTSDETKPERMLTKRGKYWYWTVSMTRETLEQNEGDIHFLCSLAANNLDAEVIRAKGKQTKYHRAKILIGKADYYYDWEF